MAPRITESGDEDDVEDEQPTEEEDELSSPEEMEQDVSEYEDEGDEEEADESMTVTPASSRRIVAASMQSATLASNSEPPIKLKLKLGSAPQTPVIGQLKNEGKRVRKRPKHLEEDELSSDDSDESNYLSKQTARQRGEAPLQALPLDQPSKKKKELTESELALKKAEESRKRKHQSHKKLEDEKAETINRLLKKQVGKASSRTPKSTPGGSTPAEPSDDQVTGKSSKDMTPKPTLPTLFRYTSTIKSGNYEAFMSAPLGLEKSSIITMSEGSKTTPKYPGPRPRPKTRYLKT